MGFVKGFREAFFVFVAGGGGGHVLGGVLLDFVCVCWIFEVVCRIFFGGVS